MNWFRRVICILLCAVMTVFALAACGSDDPGDSTGDGKGKTSEKQTGLRLSETDVTMTIGDTNRTLKAYSLETGKEVATVVWESADPSVVTIDPSGKLTAVSEGSTTVRAENIKDHTDAVCSVTVIAKAEGITLNETDVTIMVAGEYQIEAQMNPPTLESRFTYQSKDPGIASVTADGKVTGLKSGTTQVIVKAESSGYTATCTIKVYDYVTGVTMNDSKIFMHVGETDRQIGYTLAPANSLPTDVKWTSSDESVVSVSENGIATAHKAGTATLTVTVGNGTALGVNASVQVEVSAEAIGIVLSQTALTLEVNQSHRLTATVTPSSSADLIWNSSDPKVATVSQSGEVHALKLGKTVITVQTADGSATASCQVTVGGEMSVYFEESEITLAMGNSQKLIPMFTPEGYAETLTWKSSNNLVVNVDQNGIVTAKGVGTATVSVTGNSSGIKAEITIHVEKSVLTVKITEIRLKSDTVSIGVGEYAKVDLELLPENANEGYSYRIVSGSSFVRITEDGLFAVAEGYATVVVRSASGVESDRFVVHVQPMTNATKQKLTQQYNALVNAENKLNQDNLAAISAKYDANIKNYEERLKSMGLTSAEDYLALKEDLETQLSEQRAIYEQAVKDGDGETAAAAEQAIKDLEKSLDSLEAALYYLEKLDEELNRKQAEVDVETKRHDAVMKEINDQYDYLLPYLN